jgi:hypothetical protein
MKVARGVCFGLKADGGGEPPPRYFFFREKKCSHK